MNVRETEREIVEEASGGAAAWGGWGRMRRRQRASWDPAWVRGREHRHRAVFCLMVSYGKCARVQGSEVIVLVGLIRSPLLS